MMGHWLIHFRTAFMALLVCATLAACGGALSRGGGQGDSMNVHVNELRRAGTPMERQRLLMDYKASGPTLNQVRAVMSCYPEFDDTGSMGHGQTLIELGVAQYQRMLLHEREALGSWLASVATKVDDRTWRRYAWRLMDTLDYAVAEEELTEAVRFERSVSEEPELRKSDGKNNPDFYDVEAVVILDVMGRLGRRHYPESKWWQKLILYPTSPDVPVWKHPR